MSIPKDTRQIMINLMYLVLTAMLALNISSEILNAFKILNAGIGKSNESIEGKNQETMVGFQANQDMKGHEERVKPYNDKAKAVRAKAKEVYDYLEQWKEKIVKESGGYEKTKEGQKIKNEENIDASTYLLVEKKGGNEIKQKLTELRTFMLDQIDKPEARKALDRDLSIQIVDPHKNEDNPNGDWATGNFYHVPTLGIIALMSKMQNDVRTSEAAIINELFKAAEAIPIKFDAITALAVPKTTYALVGQQVEASIMVAAYNQSVNPQISASSGSVVVEKGIGSWKSVASGLGMQTVRGQLKINLGDRELTQPWEFQYMVGSAGASLQLDKMNVFYIGVPNPITVTAAGYSLEDVSINIPGATLTPTGKGKYNVMVTQGPKVTATINAKTAKGTESVGGMDIRVKRIPDPVAKCANKIGGTIPASVMRAQLGIFAVLENFDFDAKFEITSFEFSYQKRRQDYQALGNQSGPRFQGDVLKYVTTASVGDRVYIENIRAKGPDGTTRALNNIFFLLN